MASSDASRGVRHVRCPKCHSLLQEPGAPVYQCGGCGAALRAKPRSGDAASTSRSSTPPPDARTSRREESGGLVSARRHGSPTSDVASTSSTPASRRQGNNIESRRETTGGLVSARRDASGDAAASTSSTPDVTTSRSQATDTVIRRESGHPVSASKRVWENLPAADTEGHDQSADQRACDRSEFRRRRNTDDAERDAVPPSVSVDFSFSFRNRGAASELQADTEKTSKSLAELPDAARRKHSAQAAAQPQFHGREGLGPKSAQQAAESKPSRDVAASAAAAAGGKMPSPPRRDELQAENLAPLREKILKTVDALKGDLSELFSKSPDLNPTKRARPPHLPKQEGRTASTFPARARRAAAVGDQHGHGCAAKTAKDGRAAAAPPRGLPSRRYRRCRADPPCCDDLQPRPCGRHGFCRHHCHHGKPECSSCRGHCARPRAQEPSASRKTPPAAAEAKRRPPPPRHHCRPVLKGAPFIICSSCFNLLQVPADFAVSTSRLRKLRCGSCSAVLSYSYGDPARKKNHPQDSVDQFSSDGSDSFVHGGEGNPHPDPFAPFLDDFGLSSYSTEDEQPLHVSRNTSFDTLDGVKRVGRLHRLMGCASASELLRHSPDLYESVDERTTPDYDRKGKGVCIDAEDDDLDDSDDEDSGAHKRSAAKGAVWPLPGMPGKGAPGAGAIRIKS